MAQNVKVNLHGKYTGEGYAVVEGVQVTKPSGCNGNGSLLIQRTTYASKEDAANANPQNQNAPQGFNLIQIPIGPNPTKLPPLAQTQPDGTTLITPVPDLPAYKDLVGAPLSKWTTLPEGVTTAQELFDKLTLHDLLFGLGYHVMDLLPDSKTATPA